MTGTRKRLDSMRITTVSPDETVQVTMGSGGVAVTLETSGHTDDSLASQVQRALNRVTRGHAQAVSEVHNQARGGRDQPTDTPAAKRRDLMQAAVSEHVVAVGEGPQGYATVTWRGMSDIEFSLRSGAVEYLSRDELSREVNVAITDAGRKREHQIVDIYRLIYMGRSSTKSGEHE